MWVVIAGLLLLAMLMDVHAEGSKEFTANGGNRAYLSYRNDSPAAQGGLLVRTFVKVYVNAGETLNLGSSANGLGAASIRLTRPDATTTNSPAIGASFIGVITNRVQETNGPLPNAGGYNPWSVTVQAGQGGVWIVEFISPSAADTTTGSSTAIAANANWTRAANQSATTSSVLAWDVTVRSSGGATINGRAYLNKFSGNMYANSINLNAITTVVTRDGFRYLANANGIDPFLFHFFVNNRGFRTNGTAPLLQSVALAGANFQDPEIADTALDTTAKIYFTTPAADLPAAAPIAPAWGTNTWLNVSPAYPIISNFDYVGADGTPHAFGAGVGGTIIFDSSAAGSYRIEMDMDGNGSVTNAVDVVLQGAMVAGSNSVTWNGLNGLGAPAPASGSPSSFGLKSTPLAGEVHFPYLDAENNPNGLILQRLNGNSAPDFTVYWNDLALGGTAAVFGTNSSAGVHRWTGSFGNVRGMDTWTYALGVAVVDAAGLVIRASDLQAVSKTPGTSNFVAGGSATYSLVFRNNGPNDSTNAIVSDVFPSGITNIAVVSTNFSGSGAVNSVTIATNTFTASVNLCSNTTVTFVLSGNVLPGASGSLTNVARILRGPDNGDPNDPGNTGDGNNSITNIVSVVQGTDVLTTKTGPSGVLAGTNFTYTLTVTNRGTITASNVIVSDLLPSGFNVVSATPTLASVTNNIATWPAFNFSSGARDRKSTRLNSSHG